MCLIAFHWQPNANKRLTLISNRDEFYARPSQAAHFWQDIPSIYAGRDLEMNGTWLGVSRTGRFAAVTNYRQIDQQTYPQSRGVIPRDFLNSEHDAMTWCESISDDLTQFAGFNALLFDRDQLIYLSNRSNTPYRSLSPGIYGLSNHLLDTPWPKVERAKSALALMLSETNPNQTHQKLLDAFQHSELANDDQLPDTGVGYALEKMLSAVFIRSPQYGTRTSTAITIFNDNQLLFSERNYGLTSTDSHHYSETQETIRSR